MARVLTVLKIHGASLVSMPATMFVVLFTNSLNLENDAIQIFHGEWCRAKIRYWVRSVFYPCSMLPTTGVGWQVLGSVLTYALVCKALAW